MRARLAILPVLLVAVVALMPATAIASTGHRIYLTQADPGGADKGQSEGGTSEVEVGPLWTFQMARISLALLFLALLGAGWWYYRLVVRRQRGEI
ncbi:MAG: hypothetical protein JJE05_00040 [Actinobacteria bacterium]|nr:hypothetical protein [Actinomycetota bacterium]